MPDTEMPGTHPEPAEMPVTEPALAERLAAITHRIAAVRVQATQLVERAQDASEHARDARQNQHSGCHHAEQVVEMQATLDAVEHELEGLRAAMLTRGVIEQAKGMLMHRHHYDADAAFATLVELSQKSHRKLVDVAQVMVSTWSAADGSS